MVETIQRMYEHLNWANLRILKTLETIENENEIKPALALFSHILLAEQVWFTRLNGDDSSHLPIWADVSLAACKKLVNQNQQNFNRLFSRLSDSNLEDSVTYKNSKGTAFNNSLRDILTHVALHGQYHRGQINQLLRADGYEPAVVDYIIFKR
nr:DinB family protein [Neobacillus sp. Marseille-Q6967]